MPIIDFDQLFEKAALNLYQTYLEANNILSFGKNNFPLKYGFDKGILVNRKKKASQENLLLYDQLLCPKLSLNLSDKVAIIPANYAYGALSFTEELNQTTLIQLLEKQQDFSQVFQSQIADNELIMPPLTIWLATDLASFISLNDLEDRLLAESQAPDLVMVLHKGLLVRLNEHTIRQVFALSQKEEYQSYDRKIMDDLVNITHKTKNQQYFKMAASAAYKNFFYFYIILLDLLKHQPLPDDDLSAEMVAIW